MRWYKISSVIAIMMSLFLIVAYSVGEEVKYPEPRFPSYLKPPKSIEDLMPAARSAVKQTRGMCALGLAKPGERVLIIVPPQQEEIVAKAVVRAFKERGIDADYVFDSDILGKSREEALAETPYTAKDGWLEPLVFHDKLRRFLPADMLKELKLPPPGLFDWVYKESARLPFKKYLDNHPEYDVFFAAPGGPTWREFGEKHRALWQYITTYDLLSKAGSFPPDVWRLSEELLIESIAWAEEVRVTDPEGTDIHWRVTKEQAENWKKVAYYPGHIMLYPSTGAGSRPYSFEKFPAREEWVGPIFAGAEGVIAGTSGHLGYFPKLKVYIKDGYIDRFEGGGKLAELLGVLLKHEKLQKTQYPSAPRPGYWWWWELSFGTNPKWYRPVGDLKTKSLLPNLKERLSDGTVHWGFGLDIAIFGGIEEDPTGTYQKFVKENPDAAIQHSFHIHTHFNTYKLKIRGSDQWLTLYDKGRASTLDGFEVRALASRYGDPDEVLGEAWRPAIPGINVPGNYEDYAKDPWSWVEKDIQQIDAGTYKYFSPY